MASIVNRTSNSRSETSINGPITIQTAATDAPGIARDMGDALRRHTFADQVTRALV